MLCNFGHYHQPCNRGMEQFVWMELDAVGSVCLNRHNWKSGDFPFNRHDRLHYGCR